MRGKTKKAVSRLVGIWTFLLLFIFKGAFPKPAYAFLSSVDACAANPECAAVLGSEISTAVSTPTGAGVSATTLTTTTANGTTTALVRAGAGVVVVGGATATGYAVWHYWGQAQNDQAQNKARGKYCSAYLNDFVCTIGGYTWQDPHANYVVRSAVGDRYTTQYESSFVCTTIKVYFGTTLILHSCVATSTIQRDEGMVQKWQKWDQEKRNQAVALLTDSDRQELIKSMPAGGTLNRGDKINAPTIVIPGQEEDDPNTPADERLLKKENGFFTAPGLPDFDQDGFSDQNDPDDDNDGTPDTNDSKPQNPNVPVAVNTEDEGDEVTPEVLQEIQDIINSYKPNENFKCVECASEIETYLRAQGIHGRRIKLDTPRQTDYDDVIYDDSLPFGSDAIADTGHHEGIAIRINGEEKVFDNHHPNGVTTEQWLNNLVFDSKVRFGAKFIETGYLF